MQEGHAPAGGAAARALLAGTWPSAGEKWGTGPARWPLRRSLWQGEGGVGVGEQGRPHEDDLLRRRLLRLLRGQEPQV